MALIVLSGQPCSGKSSAAALLKQLLQAHGLEVTVIDEPSLGMTRNASYKDAISEKITRGRLKSAMERQLSKRRIVVLDSLNAIKGFRYELWCVARAASLRYCMVHCDAPKEAAAAWNKARPAEQAYSTAVFEDLWGRYEEPDARSRWDQPLFRAASVDAASRDATLQGVVDSLIAAAANGAPQQQQQAPGAVQARQLRATMATTNPTLQSTNLLHELDAAAQEVIAAVAAAQELAGSSGAGRVDLGPHAEPLRLSRQVPLAELRRHKRVFLKLSTQNVGTRLQDRGATKRMFADYLRENVD